MRAVVVAAAAVVAVAAPVAAHADPVPAVPGGVHVTSISHAPAGDRITVKLSNGAVDILAPCRYEDGRRCYWDAGTRGNGRGTSFIVTRGYVFTVRGF